MKDFKVRKNLNNKPKFLGADKVISDLKEMPHWFKYFMCGAIVIILFFEFFNVQGQAHSELNSFFEPIARYQSAFDNGGTFGGVGDRGASIAVAVLYSLNGLASFTGILAISLIVYNKASQWLWQIINAFFFGLMAISVGYLGDMIMQVIIMLGCPLGWYLYEFHGSKDQEEKHNWVYNLLFALGLAIVITIVVLVIYEFLPGAFQDTFAKTGALNPYKEETPGVNMTANRVLDSMTNGFNVTAYVMQVVNIDNQFMVWPFVDVLKILKYASVAGPKTLSINLVIEFCVWLTMCLIGTYERLIKGTMFDIFARLRK